MNENKEEIKYILYCRKSTESEDKQIQSLDDQEKKLNELIKNEKLTVINIKDPLKESKSAKKPNNRPLFNEMMQMIESGEANGILCWDISRLARNSIDGGKLGYSLREGIIKSIRTYATEYTQENYNAILFGIETNVADQYIVDLRRNSKRGMISKAEKGWFPSIAPIGWLNNKYKEKGEKDIVKDDLRFPIVRKMWDLMLTGQYSVPRILDIAHNNWGLRTLKRKRVGGGKFSITGAYKMFTNIFYTGTQFEWNGKLWDAKHEPMVTLEEFDKVQLLLGKKGKPRSHKHNFPYNSYLHCADPLCGCGFTGDLKRKITKTTGKVTEYPYYKCTNKKPNYKCPNRKHIRREELERQIKEEIKKVTIKPIFKDWVLETFKESDKKEFEDRTKIRDSLNKALADVEEQLHELVQMKCKKQIDDEDFTPQHKELKLEKAKLREKIKEINKRSDDWDENIEKGFDFVTYASIWFKDGTVEDKVGILLTLGSNFLIKDGKLSIQHAEWLNPILKSYKPLEEEYERIELANSHKNLSENEKRELFAPVRSNWLPGVGSNHRPSGYIPFSIT